MAKLKSVYFTESDPSVWFETRDEADQYDRVAEVVEHVLGAFVNVSKENTLIPIVQRIAERYTFDQRWDWKEPQTSEG